MAVTNYYSVNGQIIGEAANGVRTDYLMDALGSVTGTVNSACPPFPGRDAFGCPYGTENTPGLIGSRGYHYSWKCNKKGDGATSLRISVLCCKCYDSPKGPLKVNCASTRGCHSGAR